jgi:MFS superfamily sulfate permease-like transporter
MSDSWLRQVYGFAARADFLGAVAALGGVLILDVLPGLAFGMVVSIVLLVYRTSRPRVAVLGRVPGAGTFTDVARHPENEQTPGVVIVRIDGEVYFANAQHVGFELRKHAPPGTRALIIDAEAVASIDVTSLEMFHLLVGDLDRQGTQLLFARSLDQVREQLKVTGELELLKRVYPDVPAALAAVESGEFQPPRPESM